MISYDDIKSGRAAVPAKTKPNANSIPSLIERASKRLSEAKSSAEVLEAKVVAELALHYAKVTKAANESHADCLRIITRAEIRMASEIDRGQEAGDVAKRGRKENVPASDNKVTMAELGVTRQRVNEWRKVAEAGEEKVEEAISEALADGRTPTKADVHRAAGIIKDKTKSDEDEQFEDLQRAWNAAGEGARARFLAANVLALMEDDDADAEIDRLERVIADAGGIGNALSAILGVDVEIVKEISPSAATPADTVAAPQAPQSATVPLHSPATLAGDDGHPSTPSSDALAAGQGDDALVSAKSEQAVSFINPDCQKPDTCKWAHSQASCSKCANDAMKARAA